MLRRGGLKYTDEGTHANASSGTYTLFQFSFGHCSASCFFSLSPVYKQNFLSTSEIYVSGQA